MVGDGAAGPYAGLRAHLRDHPDVITAIRVASWFDGVSPMDVLDSDEYRWQQWQAFAMRASIEHEQARGV